MLFTPLKSFVTEKWICFFKDSRLFQEKKNNSLDWAKMVHVAVRFLFRREKEGFWKPLNRWYWSTLSYTPYQLEKPRLSFLFSGHFWGDSCASDEHAILFKTDPEITSVAARAVWATLPSSPDQWRSEPLIDPSESSSGTAVFMSTESEKGDAGHGDG